MRVLIVEDDSALRLAIKRILQAEGWHADVVESGYKAMTAVKVQNYDAVILDWGLPTMDGVSVLKSWRSNGLPLTVLMLTARDDLSDRVLGLNSGADDYMTKPFEPEELVARLRALMRRSKGIVKTIYQIGNLRYDPISKELRHFDELIGLSSREAMLIEILMSNAGQATSKSQIINSMSDWESEFSANSVEIYIMRLRRKIAGRGVAIQTVRGFGYKILETLNNH